MAQSVSDMFLEKPVYEWDSHMKSIDVPDYYLTFAGIVSSAFTLTFNDSLVDALAPVLMGLFGLEPELQDFILNEYIPEVRPKSGHCPQTCGEATKINGW